MQITPNYEKVVKRVTIVLETPDECKNFMYLLNRAVTSGINYDDDTTKLGENLYKQIFSETK